MSDDNIETIICETQIATSDFLPECREALHASPEAIFEAIWCSQGNISRAAKLLTCSHSALWAYIRKDEKIKEYVSKVHEYRNDIRADVLEDLAFNKALFGDSTLIWKLLCTYGAERGYGDKQQIDMKHDIPPHIKTMLESLNSCRSSEELKEANASQSKATISLKTSNEKN